MKEFYRLKKRGKIYNIKRFSTMLELARRGLIDAHDAVYIPRIGKWIYAGGIREIRSMLNSLAGKMEGEEGRETDRTGESEDKESRSPSQKEEVRADRLESKKGVGSPGASRFSQILDDLRKSGLINDSIEELPIDFCEPLDKSSEDIKSGEKKREAEIIEFPMSRHSISEGISVEDNAWKNDEEEAGTIVDRKKDKEIRSTVDSGAKGSYPLPFEDWVSMKGGYTKPISTVNFEKRVKSDRDVTGEQIPPKKVNFLRVFLIVFIGFIVIKVIHSNIRSVAEMDFPITNEAIEIKDALQIDGEGVKKKDRSKDKQGIPQKVKILDKNFITAREMELRKRVDKGGMIVEGLIQDRLLSEIINGGARCIDVEVESPTLKKGRRMAKEMTIRVTLREVQKVTNEEQLGVAGLVIGKYMKKARLPVKDIFFNVISTTTNSTLTYSLNGKSALDFYIGKITLNEFLKALQ